MSRKYVGEIFHHERERWAGGFQLERWKFMPVKNLKTFSLFFKKVKRSFLTRLNSELERVLARVRELGPKAGLVLSKPLTFESPDLKAPKLRFWLLKMLGLNKARIQSWGSTGFKVIYKEPGLNASSKCKSQWSSRLKIFWSAPALVEPKPRPFRKLKWEDEVVSHSSCHGLHTSLSYEGSSLKFNVPYYPVVLKSASSVSVAVMRCYFFTVIKTLRVWS